MKKGAHVVVVGAGGNIGSQAAKLIVRIPEVSDVTFLDRDRYERKNLLSQDICPSDVGQFKAIVQARRAHKLNPKLNVVAIADHLENVPLGKLRGDIMLACLDSRESRRCSQEIAWRHGMKLIDAGVEPSLWLARVTVYLPAPNQPCMECSWDDRDYAQLAVRHPCQLDQPKTPPSNAPACLGALVAAHQVIECRKLLRGDLPPAPFEVLIDAGNHKLFVTSLRRNPHCRFDHATWKITALKADWHNLTVGKFLGLGGRNRSVAFGGRAIMRQLSCPSCGLTREIFRLTGRPPHSSCQRCDRPLLASGFTMQTQLTARELNRRDAARSLASLGLRAGDVITVNDGHGDQHYELGAVRSSAARTNRHPAKL